MSSLESQNDLETISKEETEAILMLLNGDILNAATLNGSEPSSNVNSPWKMLQKYCRTILTEPDKFVNYDEFISPKFPFYRLIPKSKVLDDEKLFKAVVCSKMFDDSSTFEANREQFLGKLIWFPMTHKDLVLLVFQDEIIYSMYRGTINHIRENVSKLWETLKNINFEEVLNTQETIEDQSKLVSTLQPSNDAADSSNTPLTSPNADHVSFPMTNRLKKVVLDELNRITNLDLRFKEEFKLDMKSLSHRNVQYWYDRLEVLRSYSYTSQRSQDFPKLIEIVSNLAKDVSALKASVSEQLESHLTVMQKLDETMIRFTDELLMTI